MAANSKPRKLARAKTDPNTSSMTYCGCLFNDLLVAPLQATVALVQVNGVAVHVGKDLHLDVAGPADVLFNQTRVVSKVLSRLALRGANGKRVQIEKKRGV